MRLVLAVLWLTVGTRTALSQAPALPPTAVLESISARGRAIAEYDRAAWIGTDLLRAANPEVAGLTTLLASKEPDGSWNVRFGRLTPAGDSLLVRYVVTHATEVGRAAISPRREDLPAPDPIRLAAVALRTGTFAFGEADRPYNFSVIPQADGTFLVYCLPAQTDTRVLPHGADVRFLIGADGTTILERFEMHRSLLDRALPPDALFGVHTVVTEDLPQDTDVFLVLSRSPKVPEMIRTERFIFEIKMDGSIRASLP
jgi:hypothetical protein